MTRSLKIAVADDEKDMRDYFQHILPEIGHTVLHIAEDGQELIRKCERTWPDLIITDIKMPALDGIDATMRIYEQHPVPVVLVSAYHEMELIQRANADHIFAYLIKPIKLHDLEPNIALAMHRFEQFERLRKEAQDLRQALNDRKIIERAKGILMKNAQIDEQTAFRRLQKLASDKNRKLVEIADSILTADEALRRNDEKTI